MGPAGHRSRVGVLGRRGRAEAGEAPPATATTPACCWAAINAPPHAATVAGSSPQQRRWYGRGSRPPGGTHRDRREVDVESTPARRWPAAVPAALAAAAGSGRPDRFRFADCIGAPDKRLTTPLFLVGHQQQRQRAVFAPCACRSCRNHRRELRVAGDVLAKKITPAALARADRLQQHVRYGQSWVGIDYLLPGQLLRGKSSLGRAPRRPRERPGAGQRHTGEGIRERQRRCQRRQPLEKCPSILQAPPSGLLFGL